jgi:hypothetical protein
MRGVMQDAVNHRPIVIDGLVDQITTSVAIAVEPRKVAA